MRRSYEKSLKDALPEMVVDARRDLWGYEVLSDATTPTEKHRKRDKPAPRERRPGERKLSSWDRKRLGWE